MMRPGLTVQLSVLLAFIGVLSSGATGYYAYRANRTMLVHEAEQNLLTSTDLLGERFSVAVNDVAADARVLAAMPGADDLAAHDSGDGASPDRDRLAKAFASFMQYHREYLQVRLISRAHNGLELVRYDRDQRGSVRVEGERLQEKAQFPYVFDTLSQPPGSVYISPITVNHEMGAHSAEGRPTLRLGAPVADASQKIVGVIVIDVDLGRLFTRLGSDLPHDYQMYLANEWGDFLINPDPAQTFGFDKGRRILMQDSFASTRDLFDGVRRTVMLNGLDNTREAAGSVLAFVRRPFGGYEGNRFIVLGVAKPLKDVFVGANLLGHSILRIVAVSSLFALLLAILFARALVHPLHVIAQAATDFFAEDRAAPLPLQRQDEIGALARGFDRMRHEIWAQIHALHQKQDELVHLASHDILTGLPNRMLFMESLETAIEKAAEINGHLAVLFVDLDDFKVINDRLGHAVGDRVLVAAARRLQQVTGQGWVAARLGGDEFIVLVDGPDAWVQADALAGRIRQSLEEPFLIGGHTMHVGGSIGMSRFPLDGGSSGELLHIADAAMYLKKTQKQGPHHYSESGA